jgi:hypothetical protein
LQELYQKGYWKFIVKILMKLNDFLERQNDGSERISDYLDMDLESLLVELKNQSEAVALLTSGNNGPSASNQAGKKKGFGLGAGPPAKKGGFSPFDDLDESSSDEEEDKKEVEEEEKKDEAQEFLEVVDKLAELLQDNLLTDCLGLDKDQAIQLVQFVLKFKNIF